MFISKVDNVIGGGGVLWNIYYSKGSAVSLRDQVKRSDV